VGEALAAVGTAERFLAAVDPQMFLKVTRVEGKNREIWLVSQWLDNVSRFSSLFTFK
jgi:hypothetical protein